MQAITFAAKLPLLWRRSFQTHLETNVHSRDNYGMLWRISGLLSFAFLVATLTAQTAIPSTTSGNTPATALAPVPAPPVAIQSSQKNDIAPKPKLTEDEFRAELIAHLPKSKSDDDNWTRVIAILGLVVGVLAPLVAFFAAKREDATQQHGIDQTTRGLQAQINAARETAAFSAEKEKEKARVQTALDYTGKMLDLHLRQIQDFYAPLLALAQQGKGLRDQLESYLYESSPEKNYSRDLKTNRLRLADGQGGWADFRLLDRMPDILIDPMAKQLVRRILDTDEAMVGIIQKNNGLAGVGHDISPLYGQFLAHYTILKVVFEDEKRVEPYAPGFHKIGYYPRGLDEVIAEGYKETWQAIKKYQERSDEALASLARTPQS